ACCCTGCRDWMSSRTPGSWCSATWDRIRCSAGWTACCPTSPSRARPPARVTACFAHAARSGHPRVATLLQAEVAFEDEFGGAAQRDVFAVLRGPHAHPEHAARHLDAPLVGGTGSGPVPGGE